MKFDVIYADPAWQFTNTNTGGSLQSGAAQVYDVMPLGGITALPVRRVASDASVLFLWVPTALKFSHGAPVLHAWGFDYVTTVYWRKIRKGRRMGMGMWFRNEVEELLVAKVRGDRVRPFRCQLPNVISAPVEEHSVKPQAFRDLIETATSKRSKYEKVELFARQRVAGWTPVGGAIDGLDIRSALVRLASAEDL